MPLYDDILETFREFVVFNGANPLPIGDPHSGQWNPTKAHIRDILVAMLQAFGDADALETLITEMRSRKIVSTANANFSGTTFPPGAETVIFRNSSNSHIWQLLTTAPVPAVSGKHQQDAQGRWWERVFSVQDTTPSFPNRAAAEAAALLLPTSVTQLISIESGALVIRSRTASADDPLYASGARWGVTYRASDATALVAAVLLEMRDGRVWTTNSATPSGTSPQTGADVVLTVTSTGAAIYRPIAAPVPATETATDRLDANGQWWRLTWDSQGSSSAIVALRNALAATGPIPLANIRGTDNAIIADIAPTHVTAGIVAGAEGSELVFVPVATNSAATPTIAVAGDIARDIRRIDGTALPVGTLVAGQPFLLRRSGGQYRIARGDAGYVQLAAETAARIAAVEALTTTVAALQPTQLSVTSASTLTDRNSALWTVANQYRTVTAATIADAPAGLAAPHTAAVETVAAVGGVRSIWRDTSGRIFSRTWNGTAWTAWAEQPNQASILAAIAALTATDVGLRTDVTALQVVTAPQALGRGDNAVIVTIGGVPTLTQNADGETRLRLDQDTLDYLSDELGGGGGGGGGSPVSPDLLGNTDGWNVWQSGEVLTFTSVLAPFTYPREYVQIGTTEPWISGASAAPLRLLYGDELALSPTGRTPARVTQIATLDDEAGQDGLNGAVPAAPATGITRAGPGFAALSADRALEAMSGLARWIGVRSEAVSGAGLGELGEGQPWANFLRARDQLIAEMAPYGRTGQFDVATIMHGAGDDSPTYEADMMALASQITAAGARQINVFAPGGTSERGDYASALATVEAFRNRGAFPMRIVAPLYPCARTGVATIAADDMTRLAELDALCAADPAWLPPLAFQASRTGNIVTIDFETMFGHHLINPTTGFSYSSAAITGVQVVNDPTINAFTRVQVTLASAVAGTIRYAINPAGPAAGDLRDDWSSPSITGGNLYRYALPFEFEV